MKSVLKVCRWILGIFLCLLSIGGFSSGDTVAALIMLGIGILILPVYSKSSSSEIPVLQPSGSSSNSIKYIVEEQQPFNDSSIIDVTNENVNIQIQNRSLLKYAKGVPYWKHQYVYSYEELKWANPEQKNFYNYYKYCFLKGQYLDIEGNSNYCFILLFDLINDYRSHHNILQLERQLEELGINYPKTKSYGISFLLEIVEKTGDDKLYNRIKEKQSTTSNLFSNNSFEGDYWSLGAKYKTKLNLSKTETDILNQVYYSGNNFWEIEFCKIEIIKLFLKLIVQLQKDFQSRGDDFYKEKNFLADLVVRKHFKYRPGSSNYKYGIDEVKREMNILLLKHCENAVREHYGHKRKLSTDTYMSNEEIRTEFQNRLDSKVISLLNTLITSVQVPDTNTEVELNSQNVNRWKIEFERLCNETNSSNINSFKEKIFKLGELNKRNPSIENIFFEASKFIAKIDKQTSLEMYVHYIYHDLKSVSFDNRQLTKTIQKNLFKTNEQLHEFEVIISKLIQDKDLKSASLSVEKIYQTKRRKISLDRLSIDDVSNKHSETVNLLNEYLQDEYEDTDVKIVSKELADEVVFNITSKQEVSAHQFVVSDISLSNVQVLTLDYFVKSSFTLAKKDLENFAKKNGAFTSQLIDGINEACYETLDDVLIEEEDENLIINPNYYNRIFAS